MVFYSPPLHEYENVGTKLFEFWLKYKKPVVETKLRKIGSGTCYYTKIEVPTGTGIET